MRWLARPGRFIPVRIGKETECAPETVCMQRSRQAKRVTGNDLRFNLTSYASLITFTINTIKSGGYNTYRYDTVECSKALILFHVACLIHVLYIYMYKHTCIYIYILVFIYMSQIHSEFIILQSISQSVGVNKWCVWGTNRLFKNNSSQW